MSRKEHQMTKKRKHSNAEIAAKLAEAEDLATQGKLQSEIARALGVSVMTLHRWRKRPSGSNGSSQIDQTPQTRIAELQLENSRLRRLVTDLLLGQMKLEEASQVGERSMGWPSRWASARAATNPLLSELGDPRVRAPRRPSLCVISDHHRRTASSRHGNSWLAVRRLCLLVKFNPCRSGRLGSCAMALLAHHRCGGTLAARRKSSLEPDREADPGQSGHLSVRQAARIHPRGSCIPSRRPW